MKGSQTAMGIIWQVTDTFHDNSFGARKSGTPRLWNGMNRILDFERMHGVRAFLFSI